MGGIMTEAQWVLLFAGLFLVLVVLALVARARRSSASGPVNPISTGDDTSPGDREFGRDGDLDIHRRRESDFDDDR
jgi:hypothetical protein